MPILPYSATPTPISAIGVSGSHTRVKINCGCGFRADNLIDGSAHAAGTGHTLHITGEIRPTY